MSEDFEEAEINGLTSGTSMPRLEEGACGARACVSGFPLLRCEWEAYGKWGLLAGHVRKGGNISDRVESALSNDFGRINQAGLSSAQQLHSQPGDDGTTQSDRHGPHQPLAIVHDPLAGP